MEHLKACAEIATQRTINWQKFCMKDDCKLFSNTVSKYKHLNQALLTFSLFLSFMLFAVQLCCTSCSKSASWWMRVFLQFSFSSSPVPCVAAKCWPAPPPPLHQSQEAARVVLDRLELLSLLRANLLVKKAKRKTKKKTKRVRC